MARFFFYNNVSGSSTLLQYHGSASRVVAITPYALFIGDLQQLQNMLVGALAGQPLNPMQNFFFSTTISAVLLTNPQVVLTDVNGVADLVLPTANLAEGTTLYVEGVVVG